MQACAQSLSASIVEASKPASTVDAVSVSRICFA